MDGDILPQIDSGYSCENYYAWPPRDDDEHALIPGTEIWGDQSADSVDDGAAFLEFVTAFFRSEVELSSTSIAAQFLPAPIDIVSESFLFDDQ